MSLLPLHAGALAMEFDPDTGFLRHVRLGTTELVRGIYAAVRDANWNTVPPVLSNLVVRASEKSFHLSFDAGCRRDGIEFGWTGHIRGAANGTVKFQFDGVAHSGFLSNRIGLCVLHPIRECRGARAWVVRTNGQEERGRFARDIEPQGVGAATFRDMKTLAHEVRGGIRVTFQFKGDVFEMEDQRNWTDASFKTYCTPLALPFPRAVRAGTRVRQSVTLRATWRSFRPGRSMARTALVPPTVPTHELPRLGLGRASHGRPLRALEVRRLAALQLAHLRADVRLKEAGWRETLKRVLRDAAKLDLRLELALHLPDLDGARELREVASLARGRIERVLVFRDGEEATGRATLNHARAALRPLRVPIGGGSNAHFCELNRAHALHRLGASECDFLGWPATPQVHTFDGISLFENLEALPDTVASARRMAPMKPLIVSPVTLRPRFNAVATRADPAGPADELPSTVDPRQPTLLAAAWTLGSLAALTGAGTAAVTYFETTGWRGIMETTEGSPLPDLFPSLPGAVFPVYFVFAAVAGFRQVTPFPMPPDGEYTALALFRDGYLRRIVIANLRTDPLRLGLSLPAGRARWSMLDETTLDRAQHRPESHLAGPGEWVAGGAGKVELVLQKYALVVLDLE
ncbi:MAG: hypothetical protein KF833_06090 [Verrucomicrobiae bacterium]|nr:hypothetical protein [Verrucomicrobiae bacterium]